MLVKNTDRKKELIKRDLFLIRKLQQKIDYSQRAKIKAIHDYLRLRNLLKTELGERYLNRLQALYEGSNSSNSCIICKKRCEDNPVLCNECQSILSNAFAPQKNNTETGSYTERNSEIINVYSHTKPQEGINMEKVDEKACDALISIIIAVLIILSVISSHIIPDIMNPYASIQNHNTSDTHTQIKPRINTEDRTSSKSVSQNKSTDTNSKKVTNKQSDDNNVKHENSELTPLLGMTPNEIHKEWGTPLIIKDKVESYSDFLSIVYENGVAYKIILGLDERFDFTRRKIPNTDHCIQKIHLNDMESAVLKMTKDSRLFYGSGVFYGRTYQIELDGYYVSVVFYTLHHLKGYPVYRIVLTRLLPIQ